MSQGSLAAPMGRRRAVAILAAAAGLPLLPVRPGLAADPVPRHEWRGRALGAESRLVLAHPDPGAARAAARICVDEVTRLERIFSLHDPQSELSRLNRLGRLATASHDLRWLLAEAMRLGLLSGGAFDVTVQPLWALYAGHFARHPGATTGPPPSARARALGLVDYRLIDLEGGGARLARPGMAVTLNGIAQGYITDRVAELLREAGFDRVLVQLGETRALAPAAPGRPWRIGVANPDGAGAPLAVLALSDRAVATSSGRGTIFEPSGRHHHLLDPASGVSAQGFASVTVVAERAALADALSTALAVAPPARAADLVAAAGDVRALLVPAQGGHRWLPG